MIQWVCEKRFGSLSGSRIIMPGICTTSSMRALAPLGCSRVAVLGQFRRDIPMEAWWAAGNPEVGRISRLKSVSAKFSVV
ncbi:MAG TPA: hypothetical protein VEQ63_06725 [Bryobacteraceae bacterium]|nr:hypothetical protein [Bryobacteraceae bacterium]